LNLSFIMYTGVQHDFHVKRCLCHLVVTRRVSLVERELLNILYVENVYDRTLTSFYRCSVQ
jgi:hypothetical protein